MSYKNQNNNSENFSQSDSASKGKKRIGIIIGILIIIAAVSGFILITKYSSFNFKKINFFLCSKQEQNENKTNTIIVKEESATIDAVKKVSPTVVSIIISKELSQYYNTNYSFPFDDFFFGSPFGNTASPQTGNPDSGSDKRENKKTQVGGGTGFIISQDGLILTNKHVVSDESAEYTVITNDGKEYGAKILATDFLNDLAVVKIEAKNLPVAEFGDSDALDLGQTVIAIGYSLGEYKNTVTKGVVSGIDRRIEAGDGRGMSETIDGAIQTDAAINPGNSGGPLINLSGQVIGINTAVNSEGQLVGFAIPINQAKRAVDSVKKNGKIVRPFLGVRYVMNNEIIAKENSLKVNYGALIVRGDKNTDLAVVHGSPADKADLAENDIILEVDGIKIEGDNNLAKILGNYQPGDEIELKVSHKGAEKTVKVKLEEYGK